jgi:hypothetical protein
MAGPVYFDSIDVSKLSLAQLPKDAKMKNLKILYNGSKLYMQTPRLGLSWPTRIHRIPDSTTVNCKLGMSFKNMETDAEVKAFYDKLVEMDERLKELLLAHPQRSKIFKGDANTDDMIRGKFFKAIKRGSPKEEGSDQCYPDSFQPTIYFKAIDPNLKIDNLKTDEELSAAHTIDIKLFDSKQAQLDSSLEHLKYCDVVAIIDVSQIWNTSVGSGISYAARKCIVFPSESTLDSFDFLVEKVPMNKRKHEGDDEEEEDV